MYPVLLMTLGLLIAGLSVCRGLDSSGDHPGGFALLIVSGFIVYGYGVNLLFERILNRAKAKLYPIEKGFNATWKPHTNQLFRGIIARDETRISRRPQGWRELQEISNGCPSKAKDNCGSEGSAEGETCWQEQGLEWFLLPRPCLRVVGSFESLPVNSA